MSKPAHAVRTRRSASRLLARVEGNARLTAATAAVLLVLLAVEGATLLSIRSLLTPHVVVGLLLIPPILLKIGSTGWKFVRYYLGDTAYRLQGPPVPALRALGPMVVILTTVMFVSGVALLLAPTALGGRLLLIHKASFVLWFLATTVHVLGHLAETGRLAPRDWRPRYRRRSPGAGARQMTVLASLVAGVVLAATLGDHGHITFFVQHSPLFGGQGYRK